MVLDAEWFTEKSNSKVQINSVAIYKKLSSEIVEKLDNNIPVSEIINWIKNITREAFVAKYGKNPEVGGCP